MQNYRDYYYILGVAFDATADEIKKAYRRLARKYHPDLNPGDRQAEETFKDIGEAYDILSDPLKRSQYDDYSRYWKGRAGSKKPKPRSWGWGSEPTADSDDLDYSQFRDFNLFAEQLRGRQKIPRRIEMEGDRSSGGSSSGNLDLFRDTTTKTTYTVPRARNVEARLSLPLEKAYSGGFERIRLEDGRSLEVNMPRGMFDNQKIRLKGQGINGGDLFLNIKVIEHPIFRLDGDDVICQVPVTATEAILGKSVEVPTLDGLVKINLPAGVQSGQCLRLANKGYFTARGDRGDQLVEIVVQVPTTVSDEERKLYEAIYEIESFKPRSES